jgi:hypothetical protein
MNVFRLALLGLALTSSASMANDCTAPDMPTAPDGVTSTMEQMLEGQKAVKTFQAANMEYMSCLDPMLAEATTTAKAKGATDAEMDTQKALEAQYNSAVSQEEEVAGQFNTAIRAYKVANPG